MTHNDQQPLLLDDSVDYGFVHVSSKWEHFQRISKRILKNINWFITISIIITTLSLSIISSGLITNYINQHLATNTQYFNNNDIHRNILMHSESEFVSESNPNHEIDIEKIENTFNRKTEQQYAQKLKQEMAEKQKMAEKQQMVPSDSDGTVDIKQHSKTKVELQYQLKDETKIIEALEDDVKGEQAIIEALKKKIKHLETNHLKILQEQKQHESNMIWIGIALTGTMFIGSAFLFYATIRNRNQSNSDDNVSRQNQADKKHRAPITASNVTTTNAN